MKWIIPDLLCNCRDIGGILTTDGQHIKYGKIVRSASLSKFTQENVEILKQYGVSSIIDLRAKGQADIKKDLLWNGVKYYNCPLHQIDEIKQKSSLKDQIASYDDGQHLQERTYESVFLDSVGLKSMKKIFSVLMENDGTTLIHCSQGKDRTGVILLLIELALGVSYEDCLNDYMMSNLYSLSKSMKKIELCLSDFSDSYDDAAAIIKMQETQPRFLKASYDTIVENYRTVENFLTNVLSVDIKSLRRKFLEC
jgi:protein-tyrosine phosphatase